ncbi:MAG: hypothetical protein JWL80_680 [Parcubacteria group bacterium]|nr:hypothetical protein [Parcubacteria group bacterium]
MKNIFKSVWACVAGILVGVVLSLGTDKILEHAGVLPSGNLWVSPLIIIFVLLYRNVYNVIGSYIVAKLAPSHPMRHAIIVGVLGTIVSIIGAVVTRNMNLGPEWYCWALVVLSIPSAWLGGKIFLRGKRLK